MMDVLPASASPERVSIVIPCFNMGQFLPEALESLEGQTVAPDEVLVVDDGSDDEQTLHILESCVRSGIRVVRTPNRGLGAARNAGLAACTGELICMLDADDRLRSDYVARTREVLAARPGLAFVSHGYQTFGTEERRYEPERCDPPHVLVTSPLCTTALIRRRALLEVGGYDTAMPYPGMEDWDLWISLAERGYQGAIIPEPLLYYRRRPGQMSESCCVGAAREELLRYLVRKHAAIYERYMDDVLANWDSLLVPYLRRGPEVPADPVGAAARRLTGGEPPSAAGPAAPSAEVARLSAMEQSLSWRVTAPARWLAAPFHRAWARRRVHRVGDDA